MRGHVEIVGLTCFLVDAIDLLDSEVIGDIVMKEKSFFSHFKHVAGGARRKNNSHK